MAIKKIQNEVSFNVLTENVRTTTKYVLFPLSKQTTEVDLDEYENCYDKFISYLAEAIQLYKNGEIQQI